MGIVNVTPDSFSDGGEFYKGQHAIDHALRLIDEGADVIDIGGESSRPGSEPVSHEEELRRTIPVIEGIRKTSNVPISIDTTKAAVAGRAIDAGADMINDISAGRFDPEMLPLAAKNRRPICLMHMQGTPKTMQDSPHYGDAISEIAAFLKLSAAIAVKAGISDNNIIVDPGIGFGKTADDNILILKNLACFVELGYPVLIGTSKKSFIGKVLSLDIKERLEATLATIPSCVEGGASILRVHDVIQTRRFLDMYLLCRP